jgi:phosphorylcholine metabolism protein LicD
MIHKEILTENQIKLLPALKSFSRSFGLVGGTAIALQIGHRRSIDFDMFSFGKFNNSAVERKIKEKTAIDKIIVDKLDEFTFVAKEVKFTFFHYIYEIEYLQKLDSFAKMPDLLTLAAMKALALGRRAKWKDYVDLYFIMKDFHHINEIVDKGNQIFGSKFNEKIFKAQLAYFKDINYEETVRYLPGFETSDAKIKRELKKFSVI